jgi:hypothetical protein
LTLFVRLAQYEGVLKDASINTLLELRTALEGKSDVLIDLGELGRWWVAPLFVS